MILVLEHMCYRWWENSIHLDIQSCFFEIHPQNHCNIIGTTWDETELSSSQFTLAGCFRKGGGILLSYMVIVSEAMTPTKSTSRAPSSNSESPRDCKRNFVQIHGLLVHDCPWQNVVTFDSQSHLWCVGHPHSALDTARRRGSNAASGWVECQRWPSIFESWCFFSSWKRWGWWQIRWCTVYNTYIQICRLYIIYLYICKT